MNRFLISILMFAAGAASAQVHVNGYLKKDGTYVAPHQRTAPDATKDNNYSTQGNVNPYTGKPGTVSPQPSNPYGTQPISPTLQPQPQQPAQPNIWARPASQ